MDESVVRHLIKTMNTPDLQEKLHGLDVIIQELHQDLGNAMRLRQACLDRLAECAPLYIEVDAAHWEDISLAGCNPCGEHPLPGALT
ncbi:MAG: hypothetical protein M0Z50_19590 [Planctomycetia bacterium]|nr:hypothetical protein [Planctomycetia bacterium]